MDTYSDTKSYTKGSPPPLPRVPVFFEKFSLGKRAFFFLRETPTDLPTSRSAAPPAGALGLGHLHKKELLAPRGAKL